MWRIRRLISIRTLDNQLSGIVLAHGTAIGDWRSRAATTTIPATGRLVHQGSECLYLILSTMKDGDKSALEFFTPDEIGDTDGDGMKEILDGFGRPIAFIRWAPGYSQNPGTERPGASQGTDDDGNWHDGRYFRSGLAGYATTLFALTLQTRIGIQHPTLTNLEFAPDPFDPLRVSIRASDDATSMTNDTYCLKPLLLSAGPDKAIRHCGSSRPRSRDPYRRTTSRQRPLLLSADGRTAGHVGDQWHWPESWADNITNHFIEPQ